MTVNQPTASGSPAGPALEAVAELRDGVERAVSAIGGTTVPPPGGGSVAAAAGALAAALTQMVAGLTLGRPKYAHVADEMSRAAQRAAVLAEELSSLVDQDAVAYQAVADAYKLPKAVGNATSERHGMLQSALLRATETPLAIARASAEVATLSADITERGNTNAVADAAVATLLAEAVCRGAALTVRVNVIALADASNAQRLSDAANAATQLAGEAVARALAAVERES